MATRTYSKDARRSGDSVRVGEALRALNALQKEYEDVLAVSEYWTIEEVARYPVTRNPTGPKAGDQMSRAKIVRALKLLQNTEPDFSTLEDAIRQSI